MFFSILNWVVKLNNILQAYTAKLNNILNNIFNTFWLLNFYLNFSPSHYISLFSFILPMILKFYPLSLFKTKLKFSSSFSFSFSHLFFFLEPTQLRVVLIPSIYLYHSPYSTLHLYSYNNNNDDNGKHVATQHKNCESAAAAATRSILL